MSEENTKIKKVKDIFSDYKTSSNIQYANIEGLKTKLGYSCRDHCPFCLHSKHVDKNPGDRQEECHGDLEPVSLEIDSKKGYVIIYRCKKCGAIRKNKSAKDDNMDLIIDLSSKQI